MTEAEIIRTWKDDAYRSGLSESQLAAAPANPAGLVELSDDQLTGAAGATTPYCSVIIMTFVISCYSNCDCGCGC